VAVRVHQSGCFALRAVDRYG